MTAAHLSSERFASALATRLDAEVPSSVHVFIRPSPPALDEGFAVCVVNGDEPCGGLVVSDFQLVPAGDEPPLFAAADVAVPVLGFVQDAVVRILREPWPRLSTGEIALPATRFDSNRIYLWFGPSEDRAAKTLPPIELSELTA